MKNIQITENSFTSLCEKKHRCKKQHCDFAQPAPPIPNHFSQKRQRFVTVVTVGTRNGKIIVNGVKHMLPLLSLSFKLVQHSGGSGAQCLVFVVWRLVFGVWCLVFGVWCLVLSGVRLQSPHTTRAKQGVTDGAHLRMRRLPSSHGHHMPSHAI